MRMLPLYRHVNQKSDYDDDDTAYVYMARKATSNECPQHVSLWRFGENYPKIITKYSSLINLLFHLVGTEEYFDRLQRIRSDC